MNYLKYSFILLSVPVLLLESCTGNQAAKPTATKDAPPATPTVQVSPATAQQPEYTLTLPGELMPYEQVEIFPKVKGFIKALYVDRGSEVEKGQLLALLEAPEITQQYLAAQANSQKLYENFLYSKQSYNRLKKAAGKSGAVAAIELDKAQAQLRSDSAAYAAANANTRAIAEMRSYLRIRAPFAGTITQRNVSVGALVGENTAKGAALFTIAQQGKLRLTIAIPEKHAQSLQPGTKATFTVSGRPGKVFTSSLSRNGLIVNQQERSVTAEFDVSNSDKALNGGEYAQVKLTLRRPDATMWVPAASVVRAQSGVFLLKVQDDQVQKVPVSEGIRRDSLQEVFGEITAGDLVVRQGTEELAENTQVQITTAAKPKQKVAQADKP
ncbi:MexH family multidrug efflux RND transporter periplasmic adaptor subunit [Adhaeribacter aerolatus]|uniref:MexH family multidrug efflux RND transporter periplasmic adaptor subunit n=1 Tax=Adhaeribacter aerolatus TaxID=670289 RepID=A0A512AWE1_9BACT|nr:efflux RND transporter periplasmic adaptor subunit [Adhaeribacter aerolatus]GEO04000.1 MexH family multidrug efflux RND transporter periplasmic adaptor subunit [Adhaeribacter aerolatus]